MLPVVTFQPASAQESVESLDFSKLTPQELAEASQALQNLLAAQRVPGVMAGTEDGAVSILQSFAAENAGLSPLAGSAGIEEVRFDNRDILRWFGSVFTWWRRFHPFPWQTAEPAPERVSNTFKLAVFGDWGTGLYGAPKISESIGQRLGKGDVILHVGDIYYSGTEREVKERMLAFWPKVNGAVSRALNGNHEMYTGGQAYYKQALHQFGQKASYCAFQNDHWLLAGLDTAYNDHDLHAGQVEWLESLVAAAGGRKLILFSHHQPYSLLDSQGPKLVGKLGRLLADRRIYAWYWGHEHHCVLYDSHPQWGLLGRCVGHGGFPYFREKDKFGAKPPDRPTFARLEGRALVPGALVLDGRNPYIKEGPDEYGPHGFVTLEFDGKDVFETIHDADGTALRAQPLE